MAESCKYEGVLYIQFISLLLLDPLRGVEPRSYGLKAACIPQCYSGLGVVSRFSMSTICDGGIQ